MKGLFFTIILATLLASNSSFAGESLNDTCSKYDGTILKQVTIQNYGCNTTTEHLNIRTSQSKTTWYGMDASSKVHHAGMMYDMAKTARLTGEEVDVCINPNEGYLLGVEWANSVN